MCPIKLQYIFIKYQNMRWNTKYTQIILKYVIYYNNIENTIKKKKIKVKNNNDLLEWS